MSGRIRSIKPEWLEDERLMGCSDAARVLSVGLLLLADDYGNGRGGVLYLTSRVFPGQSPETLMKALESLMRIAFVQLYTVDGQQYFHVRNWKKHQRVEHPGRPLVPDFTASHEIVQRVSREPPETLTPDLDLDLDQRPGPTTGEASARAREGETLARLSGDSHETTPSLAPTTTQEISGPDPAPERPPPTPPNAADEFRRTERDLAADRETVCPLDLLERDGVRVAIRELAENLPAPLESLEAESREFLTYWTLGKGQGGKKLNWPKELRERLRRQFHAGSLAPPGEVFHRGVARGRPAPENAPERRISARTAKILGPAFMAHLERTRRA